ncbi:LOW QUALITY PROTEIN: NADH dehydrogenase [ubiquinone] 1 alpha subcomplex subunit 3 [Astatotilapia calliptera]|uniref:LOW QUALITY PROTEIN: NADH dehydrogenase [ubiquinone] 1 alpha subcomplex subunit 3 n=1 Tax=Astatotilapia calliptera TaxID=8154 RepID=UPI000E41772C|nr:LOW QUALITY PROTEIN: NADH dehydrogenase [ubiquinone] 1 alpha subcomplex subunit 3 [Astatotilapia calliptera]
MIADLNQSRSFQGSSVSLSVFVRRAQELYVIFSSHYISHENRSVETTPDNMAGIGAFLRNAWNKEPVIMASCGIGLVGAILPFISPLTKYTAMLNAAVPYNYPVPVRDDGNMPDIPAHPREPKGRNLDWIKNL